MHNHESLVTELASKGAEYLTEVETNPKLSMADMMKPKKGST